MPRAIWIGEISFGLINIPAKLYSGVSQRAVPFNQLDPSNMARVRDQRADAETGEPVEPADLVRGYEVSKGQYVVVSDDEMAVLQPRPPAPPPHSRALRRPRMTSTKPNRPAGLSLPRKVPGDPRRVRSPGAPNRPARSRVLRTRVLPSGVLKANGTSGKPVKKKATARESA